MDSSTHTVEVSNRNYEKPSNFKVSLFIVNTNSYYNACFMCRNQILVKIMIKLCMKGYYVAEFASDATIL